MFGLEEEVTIPDKYSVSYYRGIMWWRVDVLVARWFAQVCYIPSFLQYCKNQLVKIRFQNGFKNFMFTAQKIPLSNLSVVESFSHLIIFTFNLDYPHLLHHPLQVWQVR